MNNSELIISEDEIEDEDEIVDAEELLSIIAHLIQQAKEDRQDKDEDLLTAIATAVHDSSVAETVRQIFSTYGREDVYNLAAEVDAATEGEKE